MTRITQKVRKMIRLRCGNGVPSARVSGSDSAAARAMTPRMPVQPTTKIDGVEG